MSYKEGRTWVSNDWFAKTYSISKRAVQKSLKLLKEQNLIHLEMIYKDDSYEVDKRYITIISQGPGEKKFIRPGELKFMGLVNKSSSIIDKPNIQEINIDAALPEVCSDSASRHQNRPQAPRKPSANHNGESVDALFDRLGENNVTSLK